MPSSSVESPLKIVNFSLCSSSFSACIRIVDSTPWSSLYIASNKYTLNISTITLNKAQQKNYNFYKNTSLIHPPTPVNEMVSRGIFRNHSLPVPRDSVPNRISSTCHYTIFQAIIFHLTKHVKEKTKFKTKARA